MSTQAAAPATVAPNSNRLVAGLEECEQDNRLPFVLNRNELRLLVIAGIGFFLDAYDLFIINQVALMLQYRYYGGGHLPSGLEGFIKAGANIGSVIGQFLFGYLADAFGRKAVYGKELMTIIFATILCISVPAYIGSEGGESQRAIDLIRLLWGYVWNAPYGPKVPGVCFGFFTYQSDTQEADIEFLSSDADYYQRAHQTGLF
ncbi:unnamed protein product [Rhizoctonia solani]|uniref:Major facilitator superfamily (MFS) profile domain-containing protein n=1 Tax=Rhizoctonia solani TaxID=456999 RepID=A0A8H3DVW6_9AGAM|nr:unnamed protein product [Rhizoctonia solani]